MFRALPGFMKEYPGIDGRCFLCIRLPGLCKVGVGRKQRGRGGDFGRRERYLESLQQNEPKFEYARILDILMIFCLKPDQKTPTTKM